jgi:hypothetical protein
MLAPQDKAELDLAMSLIKGVLERHTDLTLAEISLLSQAANDVRIAEKYMEADLPHH